MISVETDTVTETSRETAPTDSAPRLLPGLQRRCGRRSSRCQASNLVSTLSQRNRRTWLSHADAPRGRYRGTIEPDLPQWRLETQAQHRTPVSVASDVALCAFASVIFRAIVTIIEGAVPAVITQD